MPWLLLLASLIPAQSAPKLPIDVSRLEVGPPVVVTEVGTGMLKGEVRRLCWSPDGKALYLQTAEGRPPAEQLRHYSIALEGGNVSPLDKEPEWAARYWAQKQDRVAPGLPALAIEVVQGSENIKTGTGPAGVLDRTSSPDHVAAGNPSVENLAMGNMGNERARVVRLVLLDQEIASWTNERVIPGLRFGWGPEGSGALVHVGTKGELLFLDQAKRRHSAARVKDALLPAWSDDGGRVAFLQKVGRKKYAVAWVPVGW